LGGHNSIETCIIGNEICGGAREGIYLIDASKTWILKNKIY